MRHANYEKLKYSIRILNNGDNTYSVEVPKLPGCYSTGKTKEDCIRNIIEAIELHLEDIKKAPAIDKIPAIEVVQNPPKVDDNLISLQEACKLLDISEATIRRYIKSGKIPAYNFGKEYKFKIKELTNYIDSTRVEMNAKRA